VQLKAHFTELVGVEIPRRPDEKFEDLAHFVRGAQGRVLLENGNLDAGSSGHFITCCLVSSLHKE